MKHAAFVLMIAALAACGRPANGTLPRQPASSNRQNVPAFPERQIYVFSGPDGAAPYGETPVRDSAGNLYGTASYGGLSGGGVVFELSPGQNGSWTEKTLYNFARGTDGANPYAGVVFDKAGNLYGTTISGGRGCQGIGCGTVFKLTKSGNAWAETVLYRFGNLPDGDGPWATVTIDGSGNLFGTTAYGGKCSGHPYGTVYELQRSLNYAEKVLYSFCDYRRGQNPGFTSLLFDKAGDLLGASAGGPATGVLYRLRPSHGSWTQTVLHEFTRSEGFTSQSGLTMDAAGNLYGTGAFGGAYDVGTVWEYQTNGTLKVLYSFHTGTDGNDPDLAPVFDAHGNLIGETHNGGRVSQNGCSNECGTVYELTPQAGGGWKERLLYSFGEPDTDGYNPDGGVMIDGQGRIFAVTEKGGGYLKTGTVYEIPH